MSTLIFAFLIATLLVGLSICFQISRRTTRRLRLQGLELRTNCLLTRHPIAFISGRASLFRLFEHWNEVPSYLREHGYEVLILEPPAHVRQNTMPHAFLRALDELPEKCHIIADSSLLSELEMIARANHPNTASLTLIKNTLSKNNAKNSSASSVEDLRPLENAIEIFEIAPTSPQKNGWEDRLSRFLLAAHNRLATGRNHKVDAIETCELKSSLPWDLESRFLDLAVFLAERDAQRID